MRRESPLTYHTQPDPEPEALAQMAQVLAHRLRGLVASIEGFTDLLVDTLSSQEQRELAFKILEGAARVESILADLQLYGEQPHPVHLPVKVTDLLTSLTAAVPGQDLRRVDIHVAPAAAKHTLRADPYLARQAILVLLQNALEATRDGGVRVEVDLDAAADELRFAVCNPGVIGAEHASDVVFAPFYTTKAQNLGVGLSIARRIAEQHGGSLHLTTNSVEDGIAFTLVLPA